MNLFAKAKKLKLPARASVYYMGAAVIGKSVGFLATPFFTRLMSSEEYGEFTLYITLLGIASVICSAVYSGSGVYRALQIYEDKSESLIKSLLVVTIGFSLSVCLLLFTFSAFLGIKSRLLLPLSIQLMCDGIVGVFYSRAKFSYNYRSVSVMTLISAVAPSFISIAALFLGSAGGVRIYSLLFVSVILALYALLKLLGKDGFVNKEMIKYSFRQTLPILPHGISSALSAQSDKLIITAVSGSVALAKYSVAHSLGGATAFLGTAIGSSLYPWMIRRFEGNRIYEVRRLVSVVFSLLCAVSLLPVILAPELLKILAPSEYRDSLGAVLPIALSTLPAFLISTATVGLVFKSKGRYTAAVSLITAIVSIALSVIFTELFGYTGAGLALLTSQTVGAAVGGLLLKKCALGEILDHRKITSVFALSASVGVFALVGSAQLPFRVLLLIVPSVMILNLLFGYGPQFLEKQISHHAYGRCS